MNVRYCFYSLALVVLCGLLICSYFLGKRNGSQVFSETITNNTHKTTLPVETKIIRENVPAKIDTVFVDGRLYEVASHRELINENNVSVELDIEYSEYNKLFDIRHNIRTVRDSIYVEKIVDRVVEHRPAFLRPIMGMSIGTGSIGENKYNVSYGDVSAGIKISDKYSTQVFAGFRESQKPVYGIRLGIDF